jgi:hypothetical protein
MIGSASLRRSISDSGRRGYGHHRQSRSEDLHGGFLAPGGSGVGGFGFAPGSGSQFLAPTDVVPNIRGHHRRTSSGSWSARTSPYPSPHASPRGAIEPLPNVAVSARRGMMPAAAGSGGGSPYMGGGGVLPDLGQGVAMDARAIPTAKSVQGVIPVQKQNVTTHATKDASEKRRKTDATFTCPVPGCGSTFTRHFNLKGMFLF